MAQNIEQQLAEIKALLENGTKISEAALLSVFNDETILAIGSDGNLKRLPFSLLLENFDGLVQGGLAIADTPTVDGLYIATEIGLYSNLAQPFTTEASTGGDPDYPYINFVAITNDQATTELIPIPIPIDAAGFATTAELDKKQDAFIPVSETSAPVVVEDLETTSGTFRTAREEEAINNFDFHQINNVAGNGYAGSDLGDDANCQASRLIGGAGGIFERETTVYEIEVIWTQDPNTIAVAPPTASVQLFHIRTYDGGTTYNLVKYIGDYVAQPTTVGKAVIKSLAINLLPTDLIVIRGLGRKFCTISSTAIVGSLDQFERVRFGNTTNTSPTAIFPDTDTAVTAAAINNGFGPALNLKGIETSSLLVRDVPGGVPTLGPDGRVQSLSSTFMDGITSSKVVACGTSITAGAQARTDGGTEWVGLLAQLDGFEMINEAQGSSQIVFPKKVSQFNNPEAIYDVEVDADSVANTFEFTNKTLAQVGLNATGIQFSFIGASELADPEALYPDISSPIYTVVSIVNTNTVEVADVSDTVSFRADYMQDTSVAGVIARPTASHLACLSATAAELQRVATLGGFNFADYGYETRIIGNNPDILLISHMYNDGANNILGIGAVDSKKRSEYLGAYNYVVDKAYEQNPYIRIAVLTNFSAYRGNNLPAEQHLLDQRDGLIEWGKYRNIPVIDQMFSYGCEPGQNWNDSDPGVATGEGLVPDGTHPGRILHKRMYKRILPEFLKLTV